MASGQHRMGGCQAGPYGRRQLGADSTVRRMHAGVVRGVRAVVGSCDPLGIQGAVPRRQERPCAVVARRHSHIAQREGEHSVPGAADAGHSDLHGAAVDLHDLDGLHQLRPQPSGAVRLGGLRELQDGVQQFRQHRLGPTVHVGARLDVDLGVLRDVPQLLLRSVPGHGHQPQDHARQGLLASRRALSTASS